MSTEADRTAGSNYLTGRLVDLARAAHWARLMKAEQPHLNEAMDRCLKQFDENANAAEAVAQLREDAISDYMMGVSEDADDPAEASFAQERVNEVFEMLELIATRAGHLRSYADQACYLIEPPVWASHDPWDAKRSPDADRPAADTIYQSFMEPTVNGDMVYMPTLGTEMERVQVGTLTGYHEQGLTLVSSTPNNSMNVQLSWTAAEHLVAQMQQLIRFHKSQAGELQ
jgi:hypothetical protein